MRYAILPIHQSMNGLACIPPPDLDLNEDLDLQSISWESRAVNVDLMRRCCYWLV